MRVHDVGVPSRIAGGVHERAEHHRHERAEPRSPFQITEHAVTVRDAVMTKRLRGDDLDIHARAQTLDRVRDEASRGVPLPTRIRGGQDDDLHEVISKTANPFTPLDSCRRRGCLHAAQYPGSPETWRKSCMYVRLP